jgi:hypothetical protein
LADLSDAELAARGATVPGRPAARTAQRTAPARTTTPTRSAAPSTPAPSSPPARPPSPPRMTLERLEQLAAKGDQLIGVLRRNVSGAPFEAAVLEMWQDPKVRREFHDDLSLLEAYVRFDVLRDRSGRGERAFRVG